MRIYGLLLIAIAAIPWMDTASVGTEGAIAWTAIAMILGIWYFRTLLMIDANEEIDEKGRIPSAFHSFKTSLYYLALMFIGLVICALNTIASIVFIAVVVLMIIKNEVKTRQEA